MAESKTKKASSLFVASRYSNPSSSHCASIPHSPSSLAGGTPRDSQAKRNSIPSERSSNPTRLPPKFSTAELRSRRNLSQSQDLGRPSTATRSRRLWDDSKADLKAALPPQGSTSSKSPGSLYIVKVTGESRSAPTLSIGFWIPASDASSISSKLEEQADWKQNTTGFMETLESPVTKTIVSASTYIVEEETIGSLSEQIANINDSEWTRENEEWTFLPSSLSQMGKEALYRRNLASRAAADAMEEASAFESVIQCLSMFSELCSSSQVNNPSPWVDEFFTMDQLLLQSAYVAESLAQSRNAIKHNNHSDFDEYLETSSLASLPPLKNCRSNKQTSNVSSDLKASKKRLPPWRTTGAFSRSSHSKHNIDKGKTHRKLPPKTSSSIATIPIKVSVGSALKMEWVKGCGLQEAAELARELQEESQKWFLDFIEHALDLNQNINSKRDAADEMQVRGSHIAAFLSQLKRVNDWLDQVDQRKADISDVLLIQTIDRLKWKIYKFLLQHVESVACVLENK